MARPRRGRRGVCRFTTTAAHAAAAAWGQAVGDGPSTTASSSSSSRASPGALWQSTRGTTTARLVFHSTEAPALLVGARTGAWPRARCGWWNARRYHPQRQHSDQQQQSAQPGCHNSSGGGSGDLVGLVASVSLEGGGDGRRRRSHSRNLVSTAKRRGWGQEDEADGVCVEQTSGRRRVYRIRSGVDRGDESGGAGGAQDWEAFDIMDERQPAGSALRGWLHSYLLPQGFPGSVAPQYGAYMSWRGVQYVFGGAMSVFTTRSLLGALGVAGRRSGEAAAAINWVLKDGAGRLGRFLFARWGRQLDCELKQFRLAGDVLMEAGAALELATISAPTLFLPMACTANLAKNLAAVASSSTRAPIYRTFALSNNLADVTAKGESVANLADIVGTVAGIALSKAGAPLLPAFLALSLGYLVASRMEVWSVELPYLNRARLAYTATSFLRRGHAPGIVEANRNEPLMPWGGQYHQGRVVLGARVEDACAQPRDLRAARGAFAGRPFALTYRPDARKVFVLLRDDAGSADCLKAAFAAHLFLHLLDGHTVDPSLLPPPPAAPRRGARARGGAGPRGGGELEDSAQEDDPPPAAVDPREAHARAMATTAARLDRVYGQFLAQAEGQGWQLGATMLNPKETRLLGMW